MAGPIGSACASPPGRRAGLILASLAILLVAGAPAPAAPGAPAPGGALALLASEEGFLGGFLAERGPHGESVRRLATAAAAREALAPLEAGAGAADDAGDAAEGRVGVGHPRLPIEGLYCAPIHVRIEIEDRGMDARVPPLSEFVDAAVQPPVDTPFRAPVCGRPTERYALLVLNATRARWADAWAQAWLPDGAGGVARGFDHALVRGDGHVLHGGFCYTYTCYGGVWYRGYGTVELHDDPPWPLRGCEESCAP